MNRIILSALFCLAVGLLWAQPGSGNPSTEPTPIDGGLSLLLAAGAALGGKKAYDAHRKKQD